MENNLVKTTEKPYDLCIDCPNLGKKCDGPNFLAASMKRLCEWAKKRKDYLHRFDPKWTNAYIAEKTGISIGTVNRFFAGNVTDIKMSSIAFIMKVLIKEEFDDDEAWGRFPCPVAAIAEDDPELKADLERFKGENIALQEENSFLKNRLESVSGWMTERTDFLKRKDAAIIVLFVLLLLSIIYIIFVK